MKAKPEPPPKPLGFEPLVSDDITKRGALDQRYDVVTPSDARAVELVVNKGVARALELASNAKDLTGVIEAATEWYKAAYGAASKEAGWGADLPQNGAQR